MAQVHPGGLWEAPLAAAAAGYRLEARYGTDTAPFIFDDPYRHWPTLGDLDLHLFNEGRHRRLWEVLGHTLGSRRVRWHRLRRVGPNARAVPCGR